MLCNKGGVNNVVLEEFSNKGIKETSGGVGGGTLKLMLLQKLHQLSINIRVVQSWKFHPHGLLQALHHGDPLERWSKVNFHLRSPRLGRVLDFVIPRDVLDHSTYHFFRHVHQVFIIGISLVKFTSCKLWVVCEVNTLIAELSPNLIHSVKSTNDKHLEIQLRCNTKVQVHTQVIVVCNEWLCSCSPWDHIHHRGFHLNEVSFIEVLPN
mmetsp:Transcript_36980/g.75452  ORF Transcript_36980/g.75452 Transcript_36980/m.75452 type:complete len:209 (-) Transcript_36980:815-1441(-)